jgi:hypothetical protein
MQKHFFESLYKLFLINSLQSSHSRVFGRVKPSLTYPVQTTFRVLLGKPVQQENTCRNVSINSMDAHPPPPGRLSGILHCGQSRTQSNACARARMALALGKLNFSCAVIGLTCMPTKPEPLNLGDWTVACSQGRAFAFCRLAPGWGICSRLKVEYLSLVSPFSRTFSTHVYTCVRIAN